MRHPFLSSFRFRLVLLVVLATLPALGLILYSAAIQRRNDAIEVQNNLLRLARLASANQAQAIEGARQVLIALSRLPEVRSSNRKICDRLMADLHQQYRAYANFSVLNLNGDVICSALPLKQPINAANDRFFRLAKETRDFAVGEYHIGRISRKALLNFGYPILDEAGKVQAVVATGLELAWLNQLAAEVELPEGGVFIVSDRNGTILVRHPNPQAWIGKSFPNAPISQTILSQPEGTTQITGVDGVERLYGFTRNRELVVRIGIPTNLAFAQADQILRQNLISLGVVSALALAAAWIGGDIFFIRKVKSLLQTIQQLRQGNLSARTQLATENGELGQLARAFDAMAAEIQQLLAREQQHTDNLRGLTQSSLLISSALSIEEVLSVILEQAYRIIGTHQAVVNLVFNQDWANAITKVYLSEKYAQWRNWEEKPDGSGIYIMPCQLKQSIRLTQAELEQHPRWRKFGKAAQKHPPLRGWLAAPLIGRDGDSMGLIQLSDKYEGDFTEEDEAILVQLARMASVAIENARLYVAEQQARGEAETANQVKDRFLAVLSHELRSPLNPILGWSKLLQTSQLDPPQIQQALSIIERNAKLQAELIEDLLDVSRILRGKLNLNVYPVDLGAIIQSAMETVSLAAQAKSIDLQFISGKNADDSAKLQVLGDPNRLQQVVWNLLSNAVKFTSSGGCVTVKLERVMNDGSKQSTIPHSQITVIDTGKGISPDFLPHIFDYFRQADSTTTRQFGGLGLGLAIVSHLVELHGGTIEAESSGEGKGATFTLRLPLASSQTPLKREPQSSPALDLKGVRVLLVDDDTDTREFVAFVLERAGAKVISATCASDALVSLTQTKLDLLLSDIGMPEMDGYMLIRQIRALPPQENGQIPAIALTAYAGDFNQQQALKAGFQRHLTKPIDPNELIQAIAILIGKLD